MNPNFFLGAITGIGIGMALMSIVFYIVLKSKADVASKAEKAKQYTPALLAALLGVLLFAGQVSGVRADTPVPLTIPTNQIFTAANDWITTFAPIAAIGIGISIALAVLGYLGSMIVKAFKN